MGMPRLRHPRPSTRKERRRMKATGIVRRIDELGRIVLPIELRRTMDIEERDRVEIYLEEDLIIVRKFEQTCLFCGAARNLIAFKEKSVCRDCIRALNKKADD